MDSGDLGVGVQNYRGFRYNWTGLPNETPAIIALSEEKGTGIYVSWNGDTETALWRFYEHDDDSRSVIGEVRRTSFETVLHVDRELTGKVSAVAIDAHGGTLTKTRAVGIEPEVLPPSSGYGVPYGEQETMRAPDTWL